jgi:cyclase
MLMKRLIPILLILNGSLVKTSGFKNPKYVGDPINSSRIFNELGADELIILDISGSRSKHEVNIDFELIESLASECFMPLCYGGRVKDLDTAKRLIRLGVEKITLNSAALKNPELIREVSEELGSASTVIAVDVKFNPINKKFMVHGYGGKKRTQYEVKHWINKCIELGAGEILLTDINREGTWRGMSKEFIEISESCSKVPMILHGGISSYPEAFNVLANPNVAGIGVGNCVSFHKEGNGVLINYPEEREF